VFLARFRVFRTRFGGLRFEAESLGSLAEGSGLGFECFWVLSSVFPSSSSPIPSVSRVGLSKPSLYFSASRIGLGGLKLAGRERTVSTPGLTLGGFWGESGKTAKTGDLRPNIFISRVLLV
jgi:hypothetical protein